MLLADCQVVLAGKRVAAPHPRMRARSIYSNTLQNLIDEFSRCPIASRFKFQIWFRNGICQGAHEVDRVVSPWQRAPGCETE